MCWKRNRKPKMMWIVGRLKNKVFVSWFIWFWILNELMRSAVVKDEQICLSSIEKKMQIRKSVAISSTINVVAVEVNLISWLAYFYLEWWWQVFPCNILSFQHSNILGLLRMTFNCVFLGHIHKIRSQNCQQLSFF